jgi:hypothetical protein
MVSPALYDYILHPGFAPPAGHWIGMSNRIYDIYENPKIIRFAASNYNRLPLAENTSWDIKLNLRLISINLVLIRLI